MAVLKTFVNILRNSSQQQCRLTLNCLRARLMSGVTSQDDIDDDIIRSSILKASLPFVPQYGWTKEAIGAGAESVGYSSASRAMFDNGGVALVNFFQQSCNTELTEQLSARTSNNSDSLAEIEAALQIRLRLLLPYLPQWPQAMALLSAPANLSTSLTLLHHLADDICHHAGRDSVDMSWYMDRGVVAALYVAGELSLVQDKSEDCQDTWSLLSRRIQDIRTCENSTQNMADITRAAFTTLGNITGFRSYQR